MIARLRSEQGFSLVEALIAAAILTMALVVFLAGLSTGVLSTSQSDRLSTAHELARSQMELTKAEAFDSIPAAYPTVTAPPGYGVTVAASAIAGGDAAIQLVTVDVSKEGSVVFSLQGYKADR